MKLIRTALFLALISIVSIGTAFAQANGSIGGTVTDATGAIIPGATVTAVAADLKQKQSITNARGEYNITGLLPGKYTLKAIAPTFGLYENLEVVVTAGEKNEMFVVLSAAAVQETLDVSVREQISNEPDNNKDATILTEKDIEALPDDPDELQAYLQALAGASAGPNGGQIYIDGFTGGQLPSKESIREIRINSNPFSAEYDRMGFGRIEILTRPGSDRFRGSANGSFNDESLNSRNPFALNRAPTQQKRFGGNVSGPISEGRSSYGVDVNNNWVDNNTIINAQVLDPTTLAVSSFRRDVQVPTKNFRISPRVDFAINDKNTAVVRYSFNRNRAENQGLSETSLPSRAFETSNREHEFRITETMIINAKTVNETRFEYSDNLRRQTGDNSVPTINVSSAFIGGGASIGNSFNENRVIEINNFTSTSFGKNSQHSVKFGGRLRNVRIVDQSENNYAGTFSFPGVCGVGGCTLSSIDQYRAKLTGSTNPIHNPTQFTLTTGNPLAEVSQTEGALFVSDDWKVVPSLLLSFGLRYENQSNINSNFNFAPRFGFAWSPGADGARSPKTVFRGGAGIFYERFGENSTLQTIRLNGTNQLNLLVSANDPDPVRRAAAIALLSQPVFTAAGVTNVPTAAQILAALPQSNTTRGVSPVLQAPYYGQMAFSVERQLFSKYTVSATVFQLRNLHQIRQRNVNAPVCITPLDCTGAVRPDPTRTNVIFYESSARSTRTGLNINVRGNISPKYSFGGNYSLGFANSDADGGTPAYSYDLTDEYSRSSGDIRHSVNFNMNAQLPWSMNANFSVNASSAAPFNITRGVDSNGDGFANERPTFGELGARCAFLGLTAGWCNVSGFDPNAIIPRNFGYGTSTFTTFFRLSKNFGFGKTAAQRAGTQPAAQGGGQGGPGGGMVMMGGGPGGGGGMRGGGGGFGGGFAGGDARRPYNLNVGISVNNLFNTVNFNNPTGNLSSARFGQPTSTRGGFGGFGPGGFGGFGGGGGANRRIELNMRFSW